MSPTKSPRLTRQRLIILEELRSVKSHPTAGEVFDMVRRRLPRISLGTVYRNLEILAESGMIAKLELAETAKRFDGMAQNHYHVRCVSCGRVDDVPMAPLPAVEQSAGNLSDYQILSHRLEFTGLCPLCRESTTEPQSRSSS